MCKDRVKVAIDVVDYGLDEELMEYGLVDREWDMSIVEFFCLPRNER